MERIWKLKVVGGLNAKVQWYPWWYRCEAEAGARRASRPALERREVARAPARGGVEPRHRAGLDPRAVGLVAARVQRLGRRDVLEASLKSGSGVHGRAKRRALSRGVGG